MSTQRRVEGLLREAAPQALVALLRRGALLADAEDAVQEALVAAAHRWPRDGEPDNPTGWLVRVAGRRLTDQLRSDAARREREVRLAGEPGRGPITASANDDVLELMFLCCHPALTPGAAIPLTLRAVAGLSTAEIAAAFLVPEATMTKRITRAKQRIADAGGHFQMPEGPELATALRWVLHVLYLLFNEGYASSTSKDHVRAELSNEAIRLTRIVHEQLPADPDAAGLLALMLLTDARRPARFGTDGALIPLDEQDRARWDRHQIDEGTDILDRSFESGRAGTYQLQAAIAVLHDGAPSTRATDWVQILGLYTILDRIAPSPVVTLNRAIAVAMVHGPLAGLDELADLDEALGGSYRLDAVRGHLQEMAGDHEAAIAHYSAAARRTASVAERNHLTLRAARLNALTAPPDIVLVDREHDA